MAVPVLFLGESHLAAVEHFLLPSFPLLDLQKEYREEDKSQSNLDDNFHRTSPLFDQSVDVVLIVQRMILLRPILPLHRPVELQLPSQVSTWPVYNKVNRCLARYSPRATSTNRPTNTE